MLQFSGDHRCWVPFHLASALKVSTLFMSICGRRCHPGCALPLKLIPRKYSKQSVLILPRFRCNMQQELLSQHVLLGGHRFIVPEEL